MNAPTIVRTNKCEKGHVFNAPVEFSDTTPRLTGETRRTCPECGSDALFSSPWRLLVGQQLFTLGLGKQLPADLSKGLYD